MRKLISDIVADTELNVAADKDIDVDKRWDIAANKKLNTAVDKIVNADKK